MDAHPPRQPCFRLALAAALTAPPARAAPQDPPRWEADVWFDRFRPTLTPRELTKAERAEVRALAAKHRAAMGP